MIRTGSIKITGSTVTGNVGNVVQVSHLDVDTGDITVEESLILGRVGNIITNCEVDNPAGSESLDNSTNSTENQDSAYETAFENYNIIIDEMETSIKEGSTPKDFELLIENFVLLTNQVFNPKFMFSLSKELIESRPELKDLNVHEANNIVLEQFFSKIFPRLENLFVTLYKVNPDLQPQKFKTLVAPQGAGKGTNIESIEEALRERADEGSKSKEFSKLLEVLKDLSTTNTGTKGVFNPSGEAKYQMYAPLGTVAGPIVGQGIMVSDSFTHSIMLLEIIRQVLAGNLNHMIDTYPRTEGQYKLFVDFVNMLKKETGKDHQVYFGIIDLLEPEKSDLLFEDRAKTKEISLEIADELLKLRDEERMKGLKVDDKSDLDEQKAQAKEIFDKLKEELDEMKEYSSSPNKDYEIRNTLLEVFREVITRMQCRVDRAKTPNDIRKDEKSVLPILTRVSEYLRYTFPIALSFAQIKIICSLDTPKNVAKSLLTDICEKQDIDFNDDQIQVFIARVGEIAERKVAESIS